METKRKFESTDVDEDGSIVKRSKASSRARDSDSEECDDGRNLLHFSDDVMLCILRYCTPKELKALSFCCRRLARLCTDRSLWRTVELRQQALGSHALTFYMRCLKSSTTSLYMRGLVGSGSFKTDAKDAKGSSSGPAGCDCVNSDNRRLCSRQERKTAYSKSEHSRPRKSNIEPNQRDLDEQGPSKLDRSNRNDDAEHNSKINLDTLSGQPGPSSFSTQRPMKESGNTSPKPFSPSYEEYSHNANENNDSLNFKNKDTQGSGSYGVEIADCCKRKTVCLASITKEIMMEIRQKCINLQDLRLEYCNLNCHSFPISDIPKKIKILSLKGCRKTTVHSQKPYLFKIQDYLPDLEELDLSYCRWLSGHSLLLLSKLLRLKKLWLRGCVGLGECVAYASLSTRFGFKALEVLDVRGTSMGDSEVSSFSFLVNLRELYLEPPFSDDDDDDEPPIDWPEHSGLMESWELEYPCAEVDEYLEIMNKDEIITTGGADNASSDYLNTSKVKSETKDMSDTNNKTVNGNQNDNDDDNINYQDNLGVFYRSVFNLSNGDVNCHHENGNAAGHRAGGDAGDRVNGHANAYRANDDVIENDQPPPVPERPEAENGMGVQVGPLGVQVGHGGVHLGPVRLQMRQAPGVNIVPPENGAPPGLGGVQVGPVEVQVGPDGVQVGVGGVRVDPAWVRDGPPGGVHVDPRWMQIAPGVHVGIEGVEVQVGQEAEEQEEHREPPVGVHVRPIEVQVRPVRVEVEREGRRVRHEQRNEGGVQNVENIANAPQRVQVNREERRINHDRRADNEADPDAAQPRERPLNAGGVQFDPIWVNENAIDPDPRLQIGFNVQLGASRANPREAQQNEGMLNAEGAQQEQENNNDRIDEPRNAQRNREDNRQMDWAQVAADGHARNVEHMERRGFVIFPDRLRVGNLNMRQVPVEGHCRHRGFMNVIRCANLEAQRENVDERERNVPFPDRVFLQRAFRRALEIFQGVHREEPNRQVEQNRRDEQAEMNNQSRRNINRLGGQDRGDEDPRQNGLAGADDRLNGCARVNAQERPDRCARVNAHEIPDGCARVNIHVRPEGQARPEGQIRPDGQAVRLDAQAGPNGQARPDEQQDRQEGQDRRGNQERQDGRPRHVRLGDQHNILDGRVHVIYVNPQYPRQPAAEVLVAAGMPRNAGFMMYNDGNARRLGREEFQIRNVRHVFDVQLPLYGNVEHVVDADLVTDVSLLHFGDSQQLVRVGGLQVGRRRYSPLEVLICRGYRGVTDQSLAHLATAAPALRHLDVAGCGVTDAGAAAFTMHRPDCKLQYNANESSDRPAEGPQ